MSAIQRLKDRLKESFDRLSAAANGRELDIMTPQWRRPDGSVEPLSRQERESVIRWKFLSTCAETMDTVGVRVISDAHEAFAETYLQADDAIGPVLILPGPERTNVIFGEGVDRPLTASERVAVDRFLDGFETYRRHFNPPT